MNEGYKVDSMNSEILEAILLAISTFSLLCTKSDPFERVHCCAFYDWKTTHNSRVSNSGVVVVHCTTLLWGTCFFH